MALDNTKQFVLFPNGQIMGGLMYIETGPDTYEPWDGTVDISFGATSIAINDGVDNGIKATVIESTAEIGVFGLVTLNPDGSNIGGGSGGGAVTVANGADVNAGSTTDAAVTGDNTGTLSAKLRGINKIIANVWDSVNSRLNVFIQNTSLAVTQSGSWVISAGSAIIGSVTINRTTPGTTNTVAPIPGQDGVAAGAGAVSATVQRVVLATDTTVPNVTGNVANDSADSGNPVKVGGVAYSPDGTAPGTAVTEGDRSNFKTDLNGRLLTNPISPQLVPVHLDGSSAYTDQAFFPDPGDGFQIVMTFLQVSTGAATAMNLFLEEGSTKKFGPVYLEAIAGRGYVSGPINIPFTASTAVTVTTSAAIAQSIDATYYIQAI